MRIDWNNRPEKEYARERMYQDLSSPKSSIVIMPSGSALDLEVLVKNPCISKNTRIYCIERDASVIPELKKNISAFKKKYNHEKIEIVNQDFSEWCPIEKLDGIFLDFNGNMVLSTFLALKNIVAKYTVNKNLDISINLNMTVRNNHFQHYMRQYFVRNTQEERNVTVVNKLDFNNNPDVFHKEYPIIVDYFQMLNRVLSGCSFDWHKLCWGYYSDKAPMVSYFFRKIHRDVNNKSWNADFNFFINALVKIYTEKPELEKSYKLREEKEHIFQVIKTAGKCGSFKRMNDRSKIMHELSKIKKSVKVIQSYLDRV